MGAFQSGAVPSNDLYFWLKVQNGEIVFISCCYTNHPTHTHAIIFKVGLSDKKKCRGVVGQILC